MNKLEFYDDLQKVDAAQRIVAGYAPTAAVDSDGEIVRKSAIEAALKDYLERGNIREMHKASAVGTAAILFALVLLFASATLGGGFADIGAAAFSIPTRRTYIIGLHEASSARGHRSA